MSAKGEKTRGKIEVAVIAGSESDLGIVLRAVAVLEQFSIAHEVRILSAHRTPKMLEDYVESLEGRGAKVVIAVAGMAAHLAGKVASLTTLPVIAVPVASGALGGLDALFSSVQMPGGVPVLTVSIGKAGATNAAIAAVEILATGRPALSRRLAEYRKRLAAEAARKNDELEKLGVEEYVRKKALDG